MDIEDFGTAIKVKRLKAGLSLDDLGALSGCSGANVRFIEETGQFPRLKLADRLLRSLNLSLIIGRKGAKRLEKRGKL